MRHRFASIGRDGRGTTVVEFAVIAPVMCMTLLAFFDFGHRMYVESVAEGALHEAARAATIGDKTGAEIDAFVRRRLGNFSADSDIKIEKKSYAEFSQIKRPEKITTDTAPIGSYNAGDCFEDANGNGNYDLDRGKTGLGGAEDVVNYEVTMVYPRIVPLTGMLGFSRNVTIKVATPLRNQPFAARTQVAIVCTPPPPAA